MKDISFEVKRDRANKLLKVSDKSIVEKADTGR